MSYEEEDTYGSLSLPLGFRKQAVTGHEGRGGGYMSYDEEDTCHVTGSWGEYSNVTRGKPRVTDTRASGKQPLCQNSLSQERSLLGLGP
jgi:hypothetical protein